MEFTMIETGWLSILPPVIAIALALLTKEVYSSLFIGIVSGMLIYAFASGGTIISAAAMTFDMMSSKISDNSYMIIFLALLWAVVSLVSRSGGSQAYGKWVETRLKSKRAAAFATSLLGILIFIDDGFNCLTVGTVMRPITDRLRISREKLAYIIDATAAPVCIIAPVSSWAVAVASEVSATDGFHVFLSTIPYNFYALLTILMVIFISYSGKDFGPMKKAEEEALLKTPDEEQDTFREKTKGRVYDLVLPILVLIICAILGMAYVGGFFEGVSFSEATDDGHGAVSAPEADDAQGLHRLHRRRHQQYRAAHAHPDPVLEPRRRVPSAHWHRPVHLRFRELLQPAARLPAGADLRDCRADELLHGHFLGNLRHADPDHHHDL